MFTDAGGSAVHVVWPWSSPAAASRRNECCLCSSDRLLHARKNTSPHATVDICGSYRFERLCEDVVWP